VVKPDKEISLSNKSDAVVAELSLLGSDSAGLNQAKKRHQGKTSNEQTYFSVSLPSSKRRPGSILLHQ